jgi:hypothetical protein
MRAGVPGSRVGTVLSIRLGGLSCLSGGPSMTGSTNGWEHRFPAPRVVLLAHSMPKWAPPPAKARRHDPPGPCQVEEGLGRGVLVG